MSHRTKVLIGFGILALAVYWVWHNWSTGAKVKQYVQFIGF
jgi:hypothetical protein